MAGLILQKLFLIWNKNRGTYFDLVLLTDLVSIFVKTQRWKYYNNTLFKTVVKFIISE